MDDLRNKIKVYKYTKLRRLNPIHDIGGHRSRATKGEEPANSMCSAPASAN